MGLLESFLHLSLFLHVLLFKFDHILFQSSEAGLGFLDLLDEDFESQFAVFYLFALCLEKAVVKIDDLAELMGCLRVRFRRGQNIGCRLDISLNHFGTSGFYE